MFALLMNSQSIEHTRLSLQGMRQGIIESGAIIIFLSPGILSRPFCQVSGSSRSLCLLAHMIYVLCALV